RAASANVLTQTNLVHIHAAAMISAMCPNTRFILVKRNLEDNVLRIYMKPKGAACFYDLITARNHVIWYHQMIDLLAQKCPDVARVVHYEDMTADPAGTVRMVGDWLGLPMPDRPLPAVGDDRGCARPYRALMAAALEG